MTKKTKKAAKKPRPKTKTVREWRVYFPKIGVLSFQAFPTRDDAVAEGIYKVGHREWRAARVRGANTLARAVGATLGPSGRIVLIDDRFGRVVATKDGVTVAKAVHLPSQEEQMGASLLRDAAIKVAETCGDGTTTCIVMAAKLLEEATKLVHGGADLVKLVREIEDAAGCAENLIMSRSQPAIGVGWDQKIANVSGNHDPRVTQSVALAFDHVGANGSISIRDGNTDRIEDALHAVRIAHRDGVQPGGGTALLRAAHWLEMKRTLGAQAVRTALREPAAKIARNAGTPEHLAPMTVAIDLSWNTGCTADGEPVDMMQFPDPTAVVVGALRAAVSVVTTLLLAETSITIEESR